MEQPAATSLITLRNSLEGLTTLRDQIAIWIDDNHIEETYRRRVSTYGPESARVAVAAYDLLEVAIIRIDSILDGADRV